MTSKWLSLATTPILGQAPRGVVGGAEWVYDYKGYYVPEWVNGVDQRPALIGSIVRTIPHPTGANGKSTAPAGVVAQWIAVKQDSQPG